MSRAPFLLQDWFWDQALVSVVAVLVSVFETLTIVTLIQLPTTITRVVVGRRLLIGAFVAEVEPLILAAILATVLNALVVTGIQRRLAHLVGTTPVVISIPITSTPILSIVASIFTSILTILPAIILVALLTPITLALSIDANTR